MNPMVAATVALCRAARVPSCTTLRVALAAACAAGGLLATAGSAQAAISYTAYIGNYGSGTLTPINTATNATNSPIAINDPSAIAVSPDGQTAWVANYTQDTVTPVNLATNTAGAAITVGSKPFAIAITPDGTMAYVTNNGSGTVTPINLRTKTAGSPITVGSNPYAIAITPDGTKAYVTNDGSATVTPITIATNTAGGAINVGSRAEAIAITPDGTTAWVGNYESNTLTPITLSTNTTGPTVAVNSPDAIAITPDGTRAYVADYTQGTVTPVTLSTRTVGSPITVGSEPYSIAITPDQATAYVANYNSKEASTVTPINLSTNAAEANIVVGSGPDSVAITPDQSPVASFTVTAGAAGSASSFDASGSSVAYGTITSYVWNFGDGTSATTSTPATTHTYAAAGSYTVTLTETDSAGTSTAQVFTGQTVSRHGGASAQTTRIASIPPMPPTPTAALTRTPTRVLPTAVRISVSSLTITARGEVVIPLVCPATASQGCRGTIRIRLAEPRAKRAAAANCARGCRSLGSAHYQARAGQKIQIRVHIASFARKSLRRRKTLAITVIATSVSGGSTVTTTHAVRLKSHAR
jgi:YVTN family beta-propeller protein